MAPPPPPFTAPWADGEILLVVVQKKRRGGGGRVMRIVKNGENCIPKMMHTHLRPAVKVREVRVVRPTR